MRETPEDLQELQALLDASLARSTSHLEVVPPTHCPVCGEPVHRFEDEVAIRCINQGCPAIVLQSLTHFASRKAMDIEGLGWQTVEALLKTGLVTDTASLYELTVEQVAELERKGEKSAKKLIMPR